LEARPLEKTLDQRHVVSRLPSAVDGLARQMTVNPDAEKMTGDV
jgi:hypothetical protein